MQLVLDTADYLALCLVDKEEMLFSEVVQIGHKLQSTIEGVAVDLSRAAVASALMRHPESLQLVESDLRIKRAPAYNQTFFLESLHYSYSKLANASDLERITQLVQEANPVSGDSQAESLGE